MQAGKSQSAFENQDAIFRFFCYYYFFLTQRLMLNSVFFGGKVVIISFAVGPTYADALDGQIFRFSGPCVSSSKHERKRSFFTLVFRSVLDRNDKVKKRKMIKREITSKDATLTTTLLSLTSSLRQVFFF